MTDEELNRLAAEFGVDNPAIMLAHSVPKEKLDTYALTQVRRMAALCNEKVVHSAVVHDSLAVSIPDKYLGLSDNGYIIDDPLKDHPDYPRFKRFEAIIGTYKPWPWYKRLWFKFWVSK